MDLRSGQPFWLAKNGILRSYPAIRNDESCDVAIVGAGIAGALLANELSEAGMGCVVLDTRDVGQGSTVASTSLLQYEIDVELHELMALIGAEAAVRAYRLGLDAIDRIEELAHKTADNSCDFERRNSFYFAGRRSHRQRVFAEYECRRHHGFDVEYYETDRIAAQFPFTAPCGIMSAGDALIDAFQFTHALLEASQNNGAKIFDRTTLANFSREDGGFRLHTDRGPSIRCDKLIFATGYESQKYLKHPRGSLYSTYVAISEPFESLPLWPGHCSLWDSENPYFYLRTTADKRIIIGGEDTNYSNDHSSEQLLSRKTQKLVRRFAKMFPDHPFELAYSWAGTFGESEDGLAFIGEPPETPGICFAMGFGGNGITMSMIAAKILTDRCMGRSNPDAAIFAFERKSA